MNNERRKMIAATGRMLEEAKADLETARDEEQDYYDNMPESFQGGDKGDTAQNSIDALEEAINAMDEVIDAAERGGE
jgi:ribosome recycling factor